MRTAALAFVATTLLLAGCASTAPAGHKTLRFELRDDGPPGRFIVQAGFRAVNGTPCNFGLSLATGESGNVTCEGAKWAVPLTIGAQYLDASWTPGHNVTANGADRTIPTSDLWVARVTFTQNSTFTFAAGPEG